jgi:hypothetical protein
MEKTFQVPKVILEPVKEINALNWINDFLLRNQMTGVLIGSVSKKIWLPGKIEDANLVRKDIDILILSTKSDFFPGQWEYGIDWWVQTSLDLAPTNGTCVSLTWSIVPRSCKRIKSGLYILSPKTIEIFQSVEIKKEVKKIQQGEKAFQELRFMQKVLQFPVLDVNDVELIFQHASISKHPKPI